MTNFSQFQELRVEQMVKPITGSTTGHFSSPSAGLDLAGAESVLIDLSTGADGATLGASHKVAFKLTHSDSESSGYTDVTDQAMVEGQTVNASTGVFKTLDGTDMVASSNEQIAYVGPKRYVKVVGTVTGTVSSPFAATATLGHLRRSNNI